MPQTPAISIVTTVYDAKEYLPHTVQSILAQTFTDFELLLVEDGSPNGCGELCDELAKTDPRIRVFHKPNGGPASAANVGLDNARGGLYRLCRFGRFDRAGYVRTAVQCDPGHRRAHSRLRGRRH